MNTAPISPVNLKIEMEGDVWDLYDFGTKHSQLTILKTLWDYILYTGPGARQNFTGLI